MMEPVPAPVDLDLTDVALAPHRRRVVRRRAFRRDVTRRSEARRPALGLAHTAPRTLDDTGTVST